MRRPAALLLVTLLALAGCGRDTSGTASHAPLLGVKSDTKQAASDLGFPGLATKNTTRVAGSDPVAIAAAVGQAVYTGASSPATVRAVTLVDRKDWRAAIAASSLISNPIRSTILFSDGKDIPDATKGALNALKPSGSSVAANSQVIRVGNVPIPAKYRSTQIRGRDPFALARAIDAFNSAARGSTSDKVLVASADDPQFALPAAAWAAKSGDPVLFVHRDTVPPDTVAAIRAHQRPTIYVLGPSKVISPRVTARLKKLGKIVRMGGSTPVTNAIGFARFVDGDFGWGVVDPGHGLVFARADADPATAAAAAPLSASGTYGPLLLTTKADSLERPLRQYLLDIQPGYQKDPVRGVYNHGWIVGDVKAFTVALQGQIDSLLEIVPVNQQTS